MSYILDALKRADAERERGHVPGLHTRSAPTFDRPEEIPPRRWLPGGLIGLALVGAAGAGLWWWSSASPESPTPVTPAVQASSPPAATQAAAANGPGPAAKPAADPTLSALPILAPEPPRPPRPASSAATQAPADAAITAPVATATATGTSSTAPASPVLSFAELSPEARARLPGVNVSGSTYSQNPAHRMLIVNGKVVQEGGEISPGLKLEIIEPRSAVLNHEGMRYRIGY